MTGVSRLKAANDDGFILSSGVQDDTAAATWFQTAKDRAFPFVMAIPNEEYVSLVFLIDPRWYGANGLMQRAREATNEVASRHGAAIGDEGGGDAGFIVRPLPADAGRELAFRLARLTGDVFPLPDEIEVQA